MMVLLHGQWQWLYFVNRLLFLTYTYCLVLLFKKKRCHTVHKYREYVCDDYPLFYDLLTLFQSVCFHPFDSPWKETLPSFLTSSYRLYFPPFNDEKLWDHYNNARYCAVRIFCNDCLVWFVKVNERSRHWNYLSTLVSVLSVAKLCFRDD